MRWRRRANPALPCIWRLSGLVLVDVFGAPVVVVEGDGGGDRVEVLVDASGEGVHVRPVGLMCGGDPFRQLGGVVRAGRESRAAKERTLPASAVISGHAAAKPSRRSRSDQ